MNVEDYCLKIIPYLLKKYDKKREGVTIDIGVGTFMFYCKVFKDNKYNSFAVEPLPSEELKEICKKNNIILNEICIYNYDGNINIHTGRFQKNDLTDVSSVHEDWWGVDDGSRSKKVDCLKFSTFLDKNNIKKITYVKIDTEGSEFEIIQQFETLADPLLPEIVEFEYGGGNVKKEGTSGWSASYFKKTLDCIDVFRKLKYQYALIFERNIDEPVELKLDTNIESQFKDSFEYGDIIFFREKKINVDDIIEYKRKISNKPQVLQKLKALLR